MLRRRPRARVALLTDLLARRSCRGVISFNRHWRVNQPEHEHIAANIVGRVFICQPSYKLVQCGLGGLIGNQRVRSDGRDTANMRDAAAFLRPHHWQYMLADQHSAVQIDVENIVPYPPIDLGRVSVHCPDANIVVENIEAAELGNSGFDKRRAIILLADIGSKSFGIEPFLPQEFECFI